MADDIKKERRRYLRHYAVVADYRLNNSDEMKASQVKNISGAGICLVLYEKLDAGRELELKIYLPDTISFIFARGRVVWVKEFKIASEFKVRFDTGVEFLKIDESDRQKITHYVASVIPKEKMI